MRKKNSRPQNRLRIIGGEYRSRQLSFPVVDGLRPTGDRLRETLFNWLAADIAGARCLDLFCGSGALGFEALSRGASHVTFIDCSKTVTAAIEHNLEQLKSDNATVICTDSLAWLASTQQAFDIVFVDPPFSAGLLQQACALLEQQGIVSEGSQLYVEQALDAICDDLPSTWELTRDKQAGQVSYRLYQC